MCVNGGMDKSGEEFVGHALWNVAHLQGGLVNGDEWGIHAGLGEAGSDGYLMSHDLDTLWGCAMLDMEGCMNKLDVFFCDICWYSDDEVVAVEP